MSRLWIAPAAVALLQLACAGKEYSYDHDQDGAVDADDCNPEDPDIFPGAEDPYGDGIDQDCDGFDGVDRDGDGYPSNVDGDADYGHLQDCNDASEDVHPGAEEVLNDGLDNDCDGLVETDEDGDGHLAGQDDCDDTDATVFLGADELPDCLDNDCDNLVDEGTASVDDDGDGFCEGQGDSCCDGTEPGDCDDDDPQVNPADVDGDGVSTCDKAPDCDDTNPNRYPGNIEACDGQDNDCDLLVPADELDGDSDGFWPCAGDCDDALDTVHPTATEVTDCRDNDCDGLVDEGLLTADDDGDGSCEGEDLGQGVQCCDGSVPGDCDDADLQLNVADADQDGVTTCAGWPAPGDCDDYNPQRAPGLPEVCDGLDNDCDGQLPPSETDADGDGYWPCLGDCEDGDDTVYPAATELVDCQDNDCDSDIDEGTVTADGDGDGYCVGYDFGQGVACCDGSSPGDCDDADWVSNPADGDGDGYSSCAGDCDDYNADRYPGNPEICDGRDNDCDGAVPVDEVDADGDGYSVCHGDCDDTDPLASPADLDGDGYPVCNIFPDCDDSDPARTPADLDHDGYTTCDQPPDCDDTVAAAFPANPEICDGHDNDCDGNIPADEADADGDGQRICAGDCDDADPGRFLLNWDAEGDGYDASCDGLDYLDLGTAALVWQGEAQSDRIGKSLASAGDVNGDGLADILFGSIDADSSKGITYLVLGRTSGWPADLTGADAAILGRFDLDESASSLAGGGDVNGDGLDDFLIGAPMHNWDSQTMWWAGMTYLVLGRTSGWPSTVDGADASFLGENPEDFHGERVALAGDVNGDGYDDILTVSPYFPDSSNPIGKIYLIQGRNGGWPTSAGDAEAAFTGENVDDWAGGAIAAAGDVNADGYDDLLIGAGDYSQVVNFGGKAYLILGRPAGWPTSLAGADLSYTGQVENAGVGRALAGAGDVDGDGYDDILICATTEAAGGNTYLILGRDTGWPADLSLADASFGGDDGGDRIDSLSPVGDVNGDGLADVLIGTGYNSDAAYRAGKAYLLLGRAANWPADLDQLDAAFVGAAEQDRAGETVSGAGDVDGDGRDDLMVGAMWADGPPTNVGKVYLLLSPYP